MTQVVVRIILYLYFGSSYSIYNGTPSLADPGVPRPLAYHDLGRFQMYSDLCIMSCSSGYIPPSIQTMAQVSDWSLEGS